MSHGTWPSPGMCLVRDAAAFRSSRGEGAHSSENHFSHTQHSLDVITGNCSLPKWPMSLLSKRSWRRSSQSGCGHWHFPVQLLFFHTAILILCVSFLNPNPQLSPGFFVTCLGHLSSECLSGAGVSFGPFWKGCPSPGEQRQEAQQLCVPGAPSEPGPAPGSQVVMVWHSSVAAGLRDAAGRRPEGRPPSPCPHC